MLLELFKLFLNFTGYLCLKKSIFISNEKTMLNNFFCVIINKRLTAKVYINVLLSKISNHNVATVIVKILFCGK